LSEKAVLVIGGGIAGIQASLDLANRGIKVYLVEKTPSIGGRMAQLDKTFPTMDCSICILAPKMIECARHPNIELLTYSEVVDVHGSVGDFTVKVLKRPRYVDEEKCTGCGLCTEKCPKKVPNEFDMGLGMRKAIYIPFPQAVPRVSIIDEENCLYFQKGICRVCEKFCPAGAIDFEQKPQELELKVGAIVVATGLTQVKPTMVPEYGYGRYKNVVTSLELERLVCASGPTRGKLLRPSDNAAPKSMGFIQCVGSRGLKEGGYPYCSSVCCMYATKEAVIIKEHDPETEVYIFYIDLRAFGKGFQEFVNRAKSMWGVHYIRAMPSDVREDPDTKDLIVRYEDLETKEIREIRLGMVVLCSALTPSPENRKLAEILGVEVDEYGFFKSPDPLCLPVDTTKPGIFMCGYCQGPKDIPESVAQASGAAARAAEVLVGRVAR